MGYSKKFENPSHSRSILAKEQPTTPTMKSITVLALVAVIAVTNAQPLTLMPPSPFEATECGNMGYNSLQIGPNCYFWVNGSFTMEEARQECVAEGGMLATLHEKADYDMLKGVVHDKYDFAVTNDLAVFWLDQMFDYDNRVLTCCDGTQKDEKDASMKGMWYPGQPCWTRDTPNMVVAFRSQKVILERPEMERLQGLYTIKTTSTWNALCMTTK